MISSFELTYTEPSMKEIVLPNFHLMMRFKKLILNEPLPRNRFSVHLISQDDVTEGVNGLVKWKGAAVLVTHLFVIIIIRMVMMIK